MNRWVPMIEAELLKLRRRRGLFWFCLFLAAGMVVVVNAVLLAYHAADPVKYGPAGGLTQFINFFTLFAITATLTSVLVGATAGAQDVESGVFRSMVATGRSRLQMALVRVPGALLFLLPMLLLGYAMEVAASFLFAAGTATPDVASITIGIGWLLAVDVLTLVVALGIAALLQSRATAIGVMIAWELAGSRVIERISAFGNGRALVSSVATDRFLPQATDTVQLGHFDTITVGLGTAVAVTIAWIVVALALNVWRTQTQDA